MTSIAILGATGSLGTHVARQVAAAGNSLSLLVRSPAKLTPEIAARAQVVTADLITAPPMTLAQFVEGNDALVCCAGLVTEGDKFVELVDRIVSAVETLPSDARPPCWFVAGAALLDLDANGRRGVDLPKIRDTYWPHRANFERLLRSNLDWRLLCPGPMVDQPAIGIDRLRISTDRIPAKLPAFAKHLPALPLLPLFAARVPEMIVPYADAAAVMLANATPGGPMSRKRVGLALPVGMRGKKDQWTGHPKKTA
jgi:putative NADH-flavin reductase